MIVRIHDLSRLAHRLCKLAQEEIRRAAIGDPGPSVIVAGPNGCDGSRKGAEEPDTVTGFLKRFPDGWLSRSLSRLETSAWGKEALDTAQRIPQAHEKHRSVRGAEGAGTGSRI